MKPEILCTPVFSREEHEAIKAVSLILGEPVDKVIRIAVANFSKVCTGNA